MQPLDLNLYFFDILNLAKLWDNHNEIIYRRDHGPRCSCIVYLSLLFNEIYYALSYLFHVRMSRLYASTYEFLMASFEKLKIRLMLFFQDVQFVEDINWSQSKKILCNGQIEHGNNKYTTIHRVHGLCVETLIRKTTGEQIFHYTTKI